MSASPCSRATQHAANHGLRGGTLRLAVQAARGCGRKLKTSRYEASGPYHAATKVEIAAVATAVPEHVIGQADAGEARPQDLSAIRAPRRPLPERRHRAPLLGRAKEWYLRTRSWEERTASYQRHALDPAGARRLQAVAEAGLSLRDIDTIVTDSVDRHVDAQPGGAADEPPRFFEPTSSGCRSSGSVAAAASADWRGRRAWRRRGRAPTCCSHRRPVLALPAHRRLRASPCSSPAALFGDGAAAMVLRSTDGIGPATADPRCRCGARVHRGYRGILLDQHRAHHGLGHQERRLWHRAKPGTAGG